MDASEISIYHAIIIACFAIAGILLFFFISVIRQQRQNMATRKINTLSAIESLERDRARIAVDLHDDLGPLLSSVKIRINSLELANDTDREELKRASAIIDDAINRIRSISYNLMPNTLIRKGLTVAVKEYVDFLDSDHKIEFTFLADAGLKINEPRSVNIYRILQEVIYNAVKHSEATKIKIELVQKRKELIIRVGDNGIGFNYKKKMEERNGIGLSSLNNRAMIGGGNMYVKTIPGKGTTYLFEMPV